MTSWRETGGEPDIARQLPCWLEELQFERQVRPIVNIVESDTMLWAWLRTFIDVGRRRLTDIGYLTRSDPKEFGRPSMLSRLRLVIG